MRPTPALISRILEEEVIVHTCMDGYNSSTDAEDTATVVARSEAMVEVRVMGPAYTIAIRRRKTDGGNQIVEEVRYRQ